MPLRRLALAGVLILAGLLAAARAGAITVEVSPPDTTVHQGDTLTVRVVTDGGSDLKGYQLVYSFDSNHLQLIDVLPGDVLTGSGGQYADFLVPDAAPTDSVWFDAACLDGTSAGPGVLMFVRFKAIATGWSPLTCEHVDFRDSQNAQTLPDCLSGEVHIGAPVPVRRTSWGTLKSRYR